MDPCVWEVLEDSYRAWYGPGLIVAGCLSVVGNCWLLGAQLSLPDLGHTHLLLLNLVIANLGRALLGGFTFAGASVVAGRWLFGQACCHMFAMTRLAFGCCQTASIALLGIERAVTSRRSAGCKLPLSFYVISVLCCWVYAAAWTIPPLFGAGRFSCDCTGTSCDVDWSTAPRPQHLPYIFSLVLLAHLLPTTAAVAGVWVAVFSHKNSSPSLKRRLEQRCMDKTSLWMVTGMVVLWLPQALLVLWSLSVAEDSLMPAQAPPGPRQLPPFLVAVGPLGTEIAGVVPVLVCLAREPKVKAALLGRVTNTASQAIESKHPLQLQ